MVDKTKPEIFSAGGKTQKVSRGYPPSVSEESGFGGPGCMFDELTGLPSFHLFEDRVQTALTGELLKDVRMRKFQIAVIGIFIRNLSQLGDETEQEQILCRAADALRESLPGNYTVARGINYHFWVMIPNLTGSAQIRIETDRIAALLTRSDRYGAPLRYNIGVSIFNGESVSQSALVGQAIAALQKAVTTGDNQVVYFSELVG